VLVGLPVVVAVAPDESSPHPVSWRQSAASRSRHRAGCRAMVVSGGRGAFV
jgi:hypothetical protein